MSNDELSIPSMGTFILIGVVCIITLLFLWKKITKPHLEPDRRKLKMEVEVERRKGERRKYPRYQIT